MTDVLMWEMLVGFLSSTFVIPVIQQPRWSTQTRAWITFGWCVLAGLGTAYLTGDFRDVHDFRAAVTGFLTVMVTASSTYLLAKKTGLPAALEAATSPKVPSPRSSPE